MSFVFVAQIKFQVEAYMCRHIKFTNTQIENGHFVTCMCVRLKKSPFLATNTHKTVKQGLAKESKFNTVFCIGKSAIGSKKSQPYSERNGNLIFREFVWVTCVGI